MANVTTFAGISIATNLISGIGGTVPKYLSWGTGAGVSARTDTTLFTETYSTLNNGTGAQRVTATVSRVTTTNTNDSVQFVGTLTAATGGASITNVGLFDVIGTSASTTTAPSGGNLFVKSDFSAISLSASDSIAFTLVYQLT